MSTATPAAGAVSPDGMWTWNGMQWVPVSGAAGREQPSRPWSIYAIAGGVLAIVGEAVLLLSDFFPYVTWEATQDYPAGSYSTFGLGLWEIAASVIFIAAGLGAAIVVVINIHRIATAIAVGALITIGLGTLLSAAGMAGTYASEGYHVGPSPFIDAAGAIVLLFGAGVALVGLLVRRPA